MRTHRLPAVVLHALLLIGAIFLLYQPTLNYGFVWDDHLYVEKNTAVQSWQHLPAAFTSPGATWSSDPLYTIAEWRPVRNISYLIDHTLYGLNPTGYHLTNIILHAITAVLVLLLLRRLLLLATRAALSPAQSIICLLAAAIWAVHPIQTEIVAWIKSRDDLLATPLLLAALLTALPRYLPTPHSGSSHGHLNPSIPRLLLSIVLYTAALLSKENAIILPGLYPVILLLIVLPTGDRSTSLPENTNSKRPLLPYIATTAALAAITIVYLIARTLILGRTAQAAWPSPNPFYTILTMLHALGSYAQLTLWPWPPTIQSADYDAYPIIANPLNPRALLGLATLLTLALIPVVVAVRALCIRLSRPCAFHPAAPAARLLAAGFAVTLIALLPFANIIPMMQILAERFLYIPTIGCAISLTALATIPALTQSRHANRLILALFATLTFALTIQTHRRLPVWQSDLTLFADNTRANPTSWRPINSLIKAHLQNNQAPQALPLANAALRRFSNDPDIIRTAALTYLLAGHETTGTILTNIAVQLQPDDPRASQTLKLWKDSNQQNP